MIDFQRFNLSDKALYDRYLMHSGRRGCEYSFANLNMWGRQRVAFVEGFLVLFSQFDRLSIYPFPLGGGDIRPALDAVIHDAHRRGIPCRLSSMTREDCQRLQALYPGQFHFHTDRDHYDYVYRIEDLAVLKGKRYQSKRNFVNRFWSGHPECRTVPLDETTLPAVKALLEQWYGSRVRENSLSDFHLEQVALERGFRRMEALGLEGMILLENGRALAMTMGSRLSPDTFDIHFEKAADGVDGAYAAINQSFARHLMLKYPELAYLNREDDMGLPGLRKAKESYHPDHMVEKYWARLWEDDDEH